MPYKAEIYKSGLHTSLFPPTKPNSLCFSYLMVLSLPCIFSNMCFVTLSKFIVNLNLHKICTGEKASIVSKAYALGCLFSDLRLLYQCLYSLEIHLFWGGVVSEWEQRIKLLIIGNIYSSFTLCQAIYWGFPDGSVIKNLPEMQETQKMRV